MPSVDKLFTIALPVRNGGEHVKECIASILTQRSGGFDLVVLETAVRLKRQNGFMHLVIHS